MLRHFRLVTTCARVGTILCLGTPSLWALPDAQAKPHLHVATHTRRVTLPNLTPALARDTRPYHDLVRRAEALHGVSADLLHAIITIESGYNRNAVSEAGAKGLMQLMPTTARSCGVRDPFEPAQNIFGGAMYLKRLAEWFRGDLVLTLAAYHAGPAAVWSRAGVPDSFRTRAYVRAVLNEFAAQLERGLQQERLARQTRAARLPSREPLSIAR